MRESIDMSQNEDENDVTTVVGSSHGAGQNLASSSSSLPQPLPSAVLPSGSGTRVQEDRHERVRHLSYCLTFSHSPCSADGNVAIVILDDLTYLPIHPAVVVA